MAERGRQDAETETERVGARPPTEPGDAVPEGAAGSQRWRLTAGATQLAAGLLTCLFTAYAAGEGTRRAQEHPGICTTLLVLTGLFAVVSLTGMVVGIWNLATQFSSSPAPLVAAAVVSAFSVALTLLGTSAPITHPIKLAWLVWHALFIAGTVVVLLRERLRSGRPTGRSAPARGRS